MASETGKPRISTGKKILFSIIILVVVFAATEMILRAGVAIFGYTGGTNPEGKMEAYQGKPWAAEYFKDTAECEAQTTSGGRVDYARFLLWDNPLNCTTPYVNYSTVAGRIRKTWSPDIASSTPTSLVKTVAVLGGSTTEGVGAIDNETIPSWLSRELNASSTDGVKYVVTNYGESGYTYTQAVMKFITKLREGKRYDYVVLYNGANDIDNAYDNGTPGALFQENWTIAQLEGTAWQKLGYWFSDQIQACVTCKTLAVIGRNFPGLKTYLAPFLVHLRSVLLHKEGDKQTADTLPAFARGIADYYAETHSLMGPLSKAYGFKYVEFWQPTLVNDTPVAGESVIVGIDNHMTDPQDKKLYDLTHQDMLALHLDNFYDLTDAFSGRTTDYYLDAVHVSGDANKVIATDILAQMKKNFGIPR